MSSFSLGAECPACGERAAGGGSGRQEIVKAHIEHHWRERIFR